MVRFTVRVPPEITLWSMADFEIESWVTFPQAFARSKAFPSWSKSKGSSCDSSSSVGLGQFLAQQVAATAEGRPAGRPFATAIDDVLALVRFTPPHRVRTNIA